MGKHTNVVQTINSFARRVSRSCEACVDPTACTECDVAKPLTDAANKVADSIDGMIGVAESLCELEVEARNASRATGLSGIKGDDLTALKAAFGRLADSLEYQQDMIRANVARLRGRYDTPSGHDHGCEELPPGAPHSCTCVSAIAKATGATP